MAGKKRTQPTSAKPASAGVISSPEVAGKVAQLRDEADKQFQAKNYSKAVDSFEQAAKLVSDAPEKADLLVKTAACHLADSKFKDAIKVCTVALEQQPGNASALKARAKAYEKMGLFKQALADAQQVNKGEQASQDSKEMEKRLRETMSAHKTKQSAPAVQAPVARQPEAPRNSFPYMITVKASLDDETRLVHASLVVSYAELLTAVKLKFPHAGPFVLQYTRDGASVTISSRNDIQSYLALLMKGMQGNARNLTLPTMRIKLVRVSKEADVPKPPAEELGLLGNTEEQQQLPQYEIDEWLAQFARLLTDVTGIDPVTKPEPVEMAQDRIFRAVDHSLSDPRALPLFDRAAEHFRDAVCTSLIQWGNVHIIKADRQAQNLLKAGQAVEGKALDAILKEYDESEKKFQEALRIRSDSWEANGSMGQLEWERAKSKISYVLPMPVPEDAAAAAGKDAKSAKEASAAVKAALAKLDAKKVGQVQKHIDQVGKWFDKALSFAKAADERKKQEAAAAAGDAGTASTAEETPLTSEQQLQSPPGNMLVMHGNILYEWSQVLAAVDKPWKPILDSAVDKFRTAGASEADIRGALKSHSRCADLDLGPDPEPEKAPEAAAKEVKEDKAKAPEAKGLPSLEVKKKTKA